MTIPVEIPYKTYLIHLKWLPYNVIDILPTAPICQNKDTVISYDGSADLISHLRNQRHGNGSESEQTWLQLLSCAYSLALCKNFGNQASVSKIMENEHVGLEHGIKSNMLKIIIYNLSVSYKHITDSVYTYNLYYRYQ
jgi:hypothetical protein